MELVYTNFFRLGGLITALVFLAMSSTAQAQFNPFPINTVDCGIVCSPECDNSGGGDDDPLCELLGTCDPGDCDSSIQSCIGDDDGGGDDGCEGADCGDNNSCSTDGVADGSSNAPNGSTGNPINLISGNKYKRQIDLAPLSGVLGLQFVRHYNSAYSKSIGLGRGWRHSYSTILSVNKGFQPGEMDIMRIQQADGRILRFERTGERKVGAQYRTRNFGDGYITTTDFGYQWRWRSGRIVSFDIRGLMTQVEEYGQVLKLRYGGNSAQLISVVDPQGRRLQLHYVDNRLAAFTDPKGQTTAFKFDKEERLVNVVRHDRRIRLYHYQDASHIWNLTGITDERGIRVQSYGYDEQGRAISSTKDINTEKVSVEYDDENQQRILTDSSGIQTVYTLTEVSGQMMIAEVRGPGCSVCEDGDLSYEYNDAVQITKVTRKNGVITEFDYDSRGRLLAHYQSEPEQLKQFVIGYEYPDTGNKPIKIRRPSVAPDKFRVTEIEYDSNGMMRSVTEKGFSPATTIFDTSVNKDRYVEVSRTSTVDYDSRGNVTKIDGPRNDVDDIVLISYDNNNRLASVKLPNGILQRVLEYDELGRPTQTQAGSQTITKIQYGRLGKPIKISKGSLSVQYEYDEVGNIIAIKDFDGKSIEYSYDNSGRVDRVSRENGPSVKVGFDDENRMAFRQMLDSNNNVIDTISYLYDASDRLSQVETANDKKKFSYDSSGYLTQIENGNGHVLNVETSLVSRIVKFTQPSGAMTAVNYDRRGRVTGVTDARGNASLEHRDDFGRLVKLENPDTGLSQYEHDEAGNVVAFKSSGGNVITQKYDAGNRIVERKADDSAIRFEYDSVTGKLSKVENDFSTDSFAYLPNGRLVSHTLTVDSNKFETRFSYNDFGRLIQKNMPDGQILDYHYYPDGPNKGDLRSVSKRTFLGFSDQMLLQDLDSNRWDGQTSMTFGNGLQTSRYYDTDGRLSKIRTSNILELDYDYDTAGRVSEVTRNGKTRKYKYDEYGRLSRVQTEELNYQYQYDEVGNRTQIVKRGSGAETTTQYSYAEESSGNQLKQAGDANYRFNQEGSTLSVASNLGAKRYEYNSEQRPTKLFIDGQLAAEYQYNGFGERIKKISYSGSKKPIVTYYLYSGGTLVAEANGDGDVTTQYLYHQGQPVVKFFGAEPQYIHTDHLGTPQQLTDDDQAVIWQADYSPFGSAEISIAATDLNLRLAGQYFDSESGSHYNYLRDYDPEIGRYLTSDPLGIYAGINTYAYVDSNPINAIDPYGLYKLVIGIEANDPTAFVGDVHDLDVDFGHA
ncbi:MAG: RHS domain-containing protein, partial [Arenicella sp.]|nr:RHS domain-containing protein [Arenicella sp.]